MRVTLVAWLTHTADLLVQCYITDMNVTYAYVLYVVLLHTSVRYIEWYVTQITYRQVTITETHLLHIVVCYRQVSKITQILGLYPMEKKLEY